MTEGMSGNFYINFNINFKLRTQQIDYKMIRWAEECNDGEEEGRFEQDDQYIHKTFFQETQATYAF